MTAPTITELEATIESAGLVRVGALSAPSHQVEAGLSDWFASFLRQAWQRWPCDGDHCPARPAWDIALDEALDSISRGVTASLEAEVLALIHQRMTEFAVTFQREHPEAQLREAESSE